MRFGDDFLIPPQSVLRSLFLPQSTPQYAVEIDCRGRNLVNTAATVDFAVTISNVGSSTAREPFVVIQVDRWRGPPSTTHDAGWRPLLVQNGSGFVGSTSIHPGAVAPPIRLYFAIGLQSGFVGPLRIECAIYALDSEPKTFSAVFDAGRLAAGENFLQQATEVPSGVE
jgi:hypothetical protein